MQIPAHLDGLGAVSPSPLILRIASKHAAGSDDDCATGEFSPCFQSLAGKILTSKDLLLCSSAQCTVSALTMMSQIAVRGKVRCHTGDVENCEPQSTEAPSDPPSVVNRELLNPYCTWSVVLLERTSAPVAALDVPVTVPVYAR